MKIFPTDFESEGICATTKDQQVFYFYTGIQSEVENAMLLMGYGTTDYYLDFFFERPCPYNKNFSTEKSENDLLLESEIRNSI